MKKKHKLWIFLGLASLGIFYTMGLIPVELIPDTTPWFGQLDEMVAGVLVYEALKQVVKR